MPQPSSGQTTTAFPPEPVPYSFPFAAIKLAGLAPSLHTVFLIRQNQYTTVSVRLTGSNANNTPALWLGPPVTVAPYRMPFRATRPLAGSLPSAQFGWLQNE